MNDNVLESVSSGLVRPFAKRSVSHLLNAETESITGGSSSSPFEFFTNEEIVEQVRNPITPEPIDTEPQIITPIVSLNEALHAFGLLEQFCMLRRSDKAFCKLSTLIPKVARDLRSEQRDAMVQKSK